MAGVERYRPTSLAWIFGGWPIALALGVSSGSRQSLGIAVVGGMLGATFWRCISCLRVSSPFKALTQHYVSRQTSPVIASGGERIHGTEG